MTTIRPMQRYTDAARNAGPNIRQMLSLSVLVSWFRNTALEGSETYMRKGVLCDGFARMSIRAVYPASSRSIPLNMAPM